LIGGKIFEVCIFHIAVRGRIGLSGFGRRGIGSGPSTFLITSCKIPKRAYDDPIDEHEHQAQHDKS
jgi:hypothetical protein